MALTFCTDICCQVTLNLKFIIVLVTICMNLISWQTAITDIYKHPVFQIDNHIGKWLDMNKVDQRLKWFQNLV
jgi:hypothetical protein